ncbi:hypothetical protein D9M71_322130 [compost metagenome]
MHFLSLLRRGGQPRPDCPYRLVSHDGAGKHPNAQILDYRAQLPPDNLKSPARLALLAGLANAEHRNKTARLGRSKLPADDFVAFTQQLAALGMADQNQAATYISQLAGSNLTRESALPRFDRAVLRTDRNRFAFQPLQGLVDIDERRKHRDVDIFRQCQLSQAFDQFRNTGTGTVHFPIAGY